MILHGEIVPRPDATPDEFKALGGALEAWFTFCIKELARIEPDVDGWIDTAALDDLQAGELPQPALLRLLGGQPGPQPRELRNALKKARAAYPFLGKTLAAAEARTVAFGFCLACSKDALDCILAVLHQQVPAGCVMNMITTGEDHGPA